LTDFRKAYTIGLIVVEQRKAKRFELSLPVELVRAGTERISSVGETRNMSSGGVLFVTGERIEVGQPIEYLITFHPGTKGELRLRCVGKVVRLQGPAPEATNGHASSVGIAATLERYEFIR
jgi:hypothetical protein